MAIDELLSIKGVAHWAQVQYPDRRFMDNERDPNLGGHYKINVEIDEEVEKVLKERGLAHLIRYAPPSDDPRDPTEKGYKYIPVKRREKYKKNGEYFDVKKPKVEKDGEPFDGLIGNGSKVEVLMKIYYSPKMNKKFVNLLKTTVLDLAEYTPPEEENSEKKEEEVVE